LAKETNEICQENLNLRAMIIVLHGPLIGPGQLGKSKVFFILSVNLGKDQPKIMESGNRSTVKRQSMCKTPRDGWTIRMLPWWFPNLCRPLAGLLLFKTLVKLLFKEVYIKLTKFRRCIKHPGEVGEKIGKTRNFLSSMGEYNRFAVEQCRQTLSQLAEQGITKVSVYGANEIAEILYDLSYELPVRITGIYDEYPRKKPCRIPTLPLKEYTNSQEKMIVAAVMGVEEKVEYLSRLGINAENLVLMGRTRKGLPHTEQSISLVSDCQNS